MTSAGSLKRAGIALALVVAAAASLFAARSAIAGKMIFLAGHVDQVFQLDAWFSPQSGVLTLDPTGTTAENIHIEIVAPSTGRSPASVGSAPTVLKRMTISRPTSINLIALSHQSNIKSGVIRIRVLAP